MLTRNLFPPATKMQPPLVHKYLGLPAITSFREAPPDLLHSAALKCPPLFHCSGEVGVEQERS